MAAYSRVSFYGEGPDNALRHEWQAYLSYLVRQRHFGRLAKSACELVVRSRRIPFLGRLRQSLKTAVAGAIRAAAFPEWLNQDFVSRLQLARTLGRNRAFVDGAMPASAGAPMLTAHSKVCCGIACLLNPTRK